MAKESVGAIWKKTINTKDGAKEILSIQIGDKKYTAWTNDYKKEQKHPDFKIFVDDYQKPNNEQDTKLSNDDLPF